MQGNRGIGPENQKPVAIACTGKMGPYPEGSPSIVCPACHAPILPGQFYTLMPIGPGGDPAKRAQARAAVPFQYVVIGVHWACVTGDEANSRLAI